MEEEERKEEEAEQGPLATVTTRIVPGEAVRPSSTGRVEKEEEEERKESWADRVAAASTASPEQATGSLSHRVSRPSSATHSLFPLSSSTARPSSASSQSSGPSSVLEFINGLARDTQRQELALQRRQREDAAALSQRMQPHTEPLASKTTEAEPAPSSGPPSRSRGAASHAAAHPVPPASFASTLPSAPLTSQLHSLSLLSSSSTPPSSSSSSLPPSLHADNTFAKVRDKMLHMTATIRAHEGTIATLQASLTASQAALTSLTSTHAHTLHTKQKAYEAHLSQQLAFIDQLIADKADLQHRVEQLGAEAGEREAALVRRMEVAAQGQVQALQAQREGMERREKAAREVWTKEERKRVKELTIKGLEGEVGRMADVMRVKQAELEAKYERRVKEVKAEDEAERERWRGKLREDKERWMRQRDDDLQARITTRDEEAEAKLREERAGWEARYAAAVDRQQAALLQAQHQHEAAFGAYRASMEARLKEADKEHKEGMATLQRRLELQARKAQEEESVQRAVWQGEQQRLWKAKLKAAEAELDARHKAEVDAELRMLVERSTLEQAAQEERMQAAHAQQVDALRVQLRKATAAQHAGDAAQRQQREGVEAAVAAMREEVEQLTSRLAVKARQVRDREGEVAALQAEVARVGEEGEGRAKAAREQAKRQAEVERRTWEGEVERKQRKHDADLAEWQERVEAAVRRKDAMIAELSLKLKDKEERLLQLEAALRKQQQDMLDVVHTPR